MPLDWTGVFTGSPSLPALGGQRAQLLVPLADQYVQLIAQHQCTSFATPVIGDAYPSR